MECQAQGRRRRNSWDRAKETHLEMARGAGTAGPTPAPGNRLLPGQQRMSRSGIPTCTGAR
eukprot:15435718-Alexandrium_andersonii.AAC.1